MVGCAEDQAHRVQAGDQWLSNLIPTLTAMPIYLAGQTVIFITMDEGDGSGTKGMDCTVSSIASCVIPTVVLSPYITPGQVDSSNVNLYGLLGTSEDVLGYPRVGQAVGQTSLRAGFGFLECGSITASADVEMRVGRARGPPSPKVRRLN